LEVSPTGHGFPTVLLSLNLRPSFILDNSLVFLELALHFKLGSDHHQQRAAALSYSG
jgi:hypothetical protein